MSTKRRRRDSEEEDAAERGPDVVPTSSSSSGGIASADEPELLVPVLDPIPKLIRAVCHADNEVDTLTALEELCDLMASTNENQEQNQLEATSLGVHFAALTTMLNWQYNENVQECCCRCLALLLWGATSATAISFAKSGGVEAILNAMKLFPNAVDVQAFGSIAIFSTFNTEKSEPEHGAIVDQFKDRFVLQIGGLEPVIQAMEKFPNTLRVQESGCVLLGTLSDRQELSDTMVKAGVVRVVGAALEKKYDNEDIKEHGKKCVRNLFA